MANYKEPCGMKKTLNLFLFLVCITHPFAMAQATEESLVKDGISPLGQEESSKMPVDIDLKKTLPPSQPNQKVASQEEVVEIVPIEKALSSTAEKAESYDFLASEVANNVAELESAKEYYNMLLERQADKAVLERRIQLDLAEGNIADALPLIQKLVIQDPTNLANYNMLAQAYLLTGDLLYAAKTYNNLVDMLYLQNEGVVEPSPYFAILKKFHEYELSLEDQLFLFKNLSALEEHDTFPLVLLAGFLIDNLRFDEAEGYLERALQINPANPKIYSLYTYIYWNEGQPEKAVAMLEDVYSKYQDPEIALELSNALIANFEYEEAYQILIRLMIETNEDPAVFEKFIGMAYVMGNYDNILNMLNLRLDQPEVLTRSVLNLFYFSEILGNSENLLKVLPTIEDPTPEYADAIYTINAKVALNEGDIPLFNEYFEKIRALGTLTSDQLALKKMMMLQEAKAYDLLDEALLENGEMLAKEHSSSLAFLESMSAFHHEDYEEMIAILEMEMRDNPQDPIAFNALGYSLIEIDPANAEKALPYISKANLMLPGKDFIQDSLAWAYYHLGDLDRAQKYIVQAYHQNKDPEIIAHYIVILDALGETDKAKDLYHRFNLFFGNSDAKAIIVDNIEWVNE